MRAMLASLPFVVGAAFTVPPELRAQNVFSLESAHRQVLGRFPQATLPAVESAEVDSYLIIEYARPANEPLCLDVHRPRREGSFPAVVIVHGGGWESGSRAMETSLALALADRGYVAIPVSYRLGQSGRFPLCLQDLASATSWVHEHAADYGIDRQRIFLLGASAGAQLVSWLGASQGSVAEERVLGRTVPRLAGVVNIDGLVDFEDEALLRQQRENPSAPTRFLGASHEDRPEVWRLASPLQHLNPSSTPFLFLQSTSASPILPGRERMASALGGLGIRSQTRVLPGTPHTFWLFEPWFSEVVAEVDRFLSQTPAASPSR